MGGASRGRVYLGSLVAVGALGLIDRYVSTRISEVARRGRTPSTSARTISLTSSSNVTLRFQPRTFSALAGVPWRSSTSAGRYFRQRRVSWALVKPRAQPARRRTK